MLSRRPQGAKMHTDLVRAAVRLVRRHVRASAVDREGVRDASAVCLQRSEVSRSTGVRFIDRVSVKDELQLVLLVQP